ncbi:MAG: metallophosphoesterase [Clostridia bacterium]|nr:metallophosphoesterase [Clostridia bacterium]
MKIYAISDLHLAIGINKPMDIFGEKWSNYMERIKKHWEETVEDEDVVIIPGDISWATYLEQAVKDFAFIEALPGKKIISKGNHDYWWTTMNKLDQFLFGNNFPTIRFLHNNSFQLGKNVLCGARGWKSPGDDDFDGEDRKIYQRELQRLELSLKSAVEITKEREIIVALHYPPFNSKKEPSGFVEIMRKYPVRLCIYGHLHGEGFKNAVTGEYEGIEFIFVSADYLKFKPQKLPL